MSGAVEPAAPAGLSATPPGARPSFARRWSAFVNERFPPLGHLLMVAAFVAGNAAVAAAVTGAPLATRRLAFVFPAVLLVFFRLRIFDEIKDWRSDRDLHPERPLARGLIAPGEARRVAAAAAVVEASLAAACGRGAFLAWLVVLGFSLLMYREFFAGPWLRPRMELYAVSHTLVAAGIGLFIAAAVAETLPWELPAAIAWLALADWMVFNVFEFARKTYAGDEERPEVDSYSRRLGSRGAALLSLAMVGAAVWAAAAALSGTAAGAAATTGLHSLALLVLVASQPYLFGPGRPTALLFRGAMRLFLAAFYIVLAVGLIWSGVR